MEFTRERTSTTKPPLLEGSGNYAYWKVRMTAFLHSLDHDVWQTVVNGYCRNPGLGSGPATLWIMNTYLKSVDVWLQQ